MSRQRCNTCGGEYEDIDRDGVRYFHACPPSTLVRVTRDGTDQQVDVTDLRATDTITVQRAGRQARVLVSELQNDDVRIGDETQRRPDARDENTATRGGEREGDRTIKRRGLGRTTIRDTPPPEDRGSGRAL